MLNSTVRIRKMAEGNTEMPDKLERCVQKVMAEGKTKDSAHAICNAAVKDGSFVDEFMKGENSDVLIGSFHDKMTFDPTQKTAVSVRDGFIEYLGAEIGMQPPDRIFKVYRSPATIANVAFQMIGIPMTDEHVAVGSDILNPVGSVVDATMIDLLHEDAGSKLAIKNTVKISDSLLATLETGKRELSLGYNAQLVPYKGPLGYDFEQREIRPHHLAVVSAGRCGSSCSFIDRKRETTPNEADAMKLHQAFTDAEGQPNLEQIVEIAQALPEAIKKLPMDEMQKVLPVLQEIVNASRAAGSMPEEMPTPEEAPSSEDEDPMKKEEIPVADTAEFKTAVQKATDSAVRRHAEVIEKAKQFLPEDYKFSDKSTTEIMADALAIEHGSQKFSDKEMDIAFKMLKKRESNYKTFGDSQVAGKFTAMADKEI